MSCVLCGAPTSKFDPRSVVYDDETVCGDCLREIGIRAITSPLAARILLRAVVVARRVKVAQTNQPESDDA